MADIDVSSYGSRNGSVDAKDPTRCTSQNQQIIPMRHRNSCSSSLEAPA